MLNGKTSALSGNSGVGKSSITKNLIGDNEILIGDVSKKISRGKNTTKYVKLYKLNNNTYIFDTPGFSSYELYNFDYRDLRKYYNDFNDYKCEYDDCLHYTENESVCSVKRALKDGKIDKGRYERYVYLLEKLKDVYDRRYK